ncbi:BA75_02114T0 [Komagataella pastoris]|uniref:3-hydroxy-3-methylglutaryl coenzyme A reductase n=1 Tax=Komagataella pastoris TaxID=4922 RepID=A0A1B2JDU9_PICPA|nr:BA75_02114T0 [Komagataella pastoris]
MLTGLSKICAHRPIHTIVVTALLVSLAYLTIVEEYTSRSSLSNPYISFYHPPGNSDYQNWVPLDDSVKLKSKSAQHLSVCALKFKRVNGHQIPDLAGSFQSADPTEIFVVQDFDKSFEYFDSISTIDGNDGIQWKVRHPNRLGRYSEYFRSVFSKTLRMVQGAEPFDIVLIAFAYVAMWYTFLQLYYEMKTKANSNFWLTFGSLLSSGCAFVFALAVTVKVYGIKVPLTSLTEGVPFLVATIGFKHKVAFTVPILQASRSKKAKEIPDTIISVIQQTTGWPLIKDHLIMISAFLACSFYAPRMEGLKNFCILSANILTFDLIMIFTFFTAVLSLKAQINKVHETTALQQVLEEDGIAEDVAERIADSNRNMFSRSTSVVSFKVIMIAGFLGFHLFVLGTSWLYDSDISSSSIFGKSNVSALSKAAAKHIPIGSQGTIVTIMPTRVYMPVDLLLKLEDDFLSIFSKVSASITDPLISKLLFIITGISATINVYLLNAARFHSSREIAVSTTAKPQAPDVVTTVEPLPNENDTTIRPLEEMVSLLKEGKTRELNNDEISSLVVQGKLPLYALEKQLVDKTRAVVVRRKAIASLADAPVLRTEKLPYKDYDYDRVFGACCENVIGFMPLPVGVAGPLIIDGKPYHIPMATTEGCLVASTMRGCKAINSGGGVETVLTADGMTRGPCVSFPSLSRAGAAKMWLDSEEGQKTIKGAFNSTSRFARLQHVKTTLAGTLLFIRFKTTTGDAMGMNMISKGVEYSLKFMSEECDWPDMEVISVSGNYCTDKKVAAINWIEGRGKSVVAEARIPADVVRTVLKSDVEALVELNVSKNLIGSAMAGSIGGFNAQAANLVTAVYLATGQDPAQNVESSNCITLMNKLPNGDLQISVSMPSIEVGTIGGGTVLEPQGSMLELLGVKGPHPTNPGANSRQLAKIVASAVLAAELSLCSALAAGHLVQSHMTHNRKQAPIKEVNGTAARLAEQSKICIKS